MTDHKRRAPRETWNERLRQYVKAALDYLFALTRDPLKLAGAVLASWAAFALLFWVLGWACDGQGVMASSDENPKTAGLGASLYFSAVTMTTLGYGDFHPVGFSRILAMLEAALGLGPVSSDG